MTRQEFFDLLGFTPYPEQAAILADPRPNQYMRCGRRFGKSILGAKGYGARALQNGEQVWWIAPDMSVAYEGLKYVDEAVSRLSRKGLIKTPKSGKIYKATPHPHFTTAKGGRIAFRTTGIDPRQARLVGAGLDLILLDEVSRIKHLIQLLDEQLLPTLMDRGGRVVAFSTPRGKKTGFADLRKRAEADPARWGVHHYSSFCNPTLNQEKIAELEAQGTPQLMRQELYAEEIDDFGAFFPHIPDIKPETPLLWTGWGWDYAMGGTAAFVKVVEDAAHRLIAVEERAGPLTWEAQVRFAGQQRQAGYDVIVDPHLEETFRADLARHSIVTRPGTSDRRGSLELLRVWLNTDLAGLALGSCPYLKTELQDAEIDERDCEEMTKDAKDHAIDAFRYAFIHRWPRAKVYHTPPKSPSDSLEAMIRRMDRAEKVRR